MTKKSAGFTLIEMITVIVILGVLAAATTSFIKFATQIYTETTTRDQLVSSARFAIERLNRDVRNALPNSLIIIGSCLRFTPILESTIYVDIPVVPEDASNTIEVIEFDESFDSNWSAVVYPLNTDDVYIASENKVYGVSSMSLTGDVRVITLGDTDVHFTEDSPTQRLYFINGTIDYCLQNNQLLRTDSQLNSNVLMAEDISSINSSFEVQEATLLRNAMVQIHFQFEKNNETVTFTNEIQVLNVP